MKTLKLQSKSKKSKLRLKVISLLLFAVIGSYLVLHSIAQINGPNSNPALGNSCVDGLDIALLVDTSDSMTGMPLDDARKAMRGFIKELGETKTYFAIGRIDNPAGITSFTNNQTQAMNDVYTATLSMGESHLRDLRSVLNRDPRPNSPNLIIILTDGQIDYDLEGARAVQQAGTRILAIGFNGYSDMNINILMDIAGPNVDTGSIWTSDVITPLGNYDSSLGEVNWDVMLKWVAEQCKSTRPAPNPGNGNGNGGTGTGTNGQGQGQGPGAGAGGGGGSSAKKIADQPNSVPEAAAQGDTTKQPNPEPSPFFDGKEYDRGSDGDTLAGTIGKAGKKVANTWPIALAVIILGGITGFGYWKWRQSRNA